VSGHRSSALERKTAAIGKVGSRLWSFGEVLSSGPG
jgi:hypothetical protein